MTISDLKQLSILLGRYQEEMLNEDMKNKKKLNDAELNGLDKWKVDFKVGVKSQFSHARIIKSRIDVELEKQITSLY